MEDYRKYLDPKTLNKIGSIDLKARLIVEGFLTGAHRSPFHGFSVEFAEHREYVPGDDVRFVDWKVFGKSDRYYIKQYEEETNLQCLVVLDTSESMGYAGSGKDAISKLEYGRYVAASLAYLILEQRDSAGLGLFDSTLYRYIPPQSHQSHLKLLLQEISVHPGEKKTDIAQILHSLAERVTKRGMVLLVSDLLDDPQKVVEGLRHLHAKRHDIVVFHVLDDDEIRFPFEQMTQFIGLEERGDVMANPRALRKSYLEEMNGYLSAIRKACRENRVDYVLINTRQPLDVALSTYLATRASARARAGRG